MTGERRKKKKKKKGLSVSLRCPPNYNVPPIALVSTGVTYECLKEGHNYN
jgi:hypothetical protein